jgi:hypothetical protein
MDAFQVTELNMRSQAGFYDFSIVAVLIHHEGLKRSIMLLNLSIQRSVFYLVYLLKISWPRPCLGCKLGFLDAPRNLFSLTK